MFSCFLGYIIAKGIVITVAALTCNLNVAILVCIVVGTLIEGVVAILFEERFDNLVVKEIIYFGGILLQIIPVIIITVPMFSMPQEDISFMMAVLMGWFGVMIIIDWFSNAFEGPVFFVYYYGVAFGFFAVEGILFALVGTSVLLIINTVIACVSVFVVIIARIVLGSNLE